VPVIRLVSHSGFPIGPDVEEKRLSCQELPSRTTPERDEIMIDDLRKSPHLTASDSFRRSFVARLSSFDLSPGGHWLDLLNSGIKSFRLRRRW
jgi:hypothetical protein